VIEGFERYIHSGIQLVSAFADSAEGFGEPFYFFGAVRFAGSGRTSRRNQPPPSQQLLPGPKELYPVSVVEDRIAAVQFN
jgi:hypothetical protein